MKALLMVIGVYAAVIGLACGGALIVRATQAKETTTLEEAINRTNSDRNVVVIKDEENGYICYYRKTADGISCVPDLYHITK